MGSDIPKVLHKLNNISLIERVIKTTRNLNTSKTVIVVGHKKELIKKSLDKQTSIEYAVQDKQKGTAHAVKMCFKNLKNFKDYRINSYNSCIWYDIYIIYKSSKSKRIS